LVIIGKLIDSHKTALKVEKSFSIFSLMSLVKWFTGRSLIAFDQVSELFNILSQDILTGAFFIIGFAINTCFFSSVSGIRSSASILISSGLCFNFGILPFVYHNIFDKFLWA
jgi:hypothetical protein